MIQDIVMRVARIVDTSYVQNNITVEALRIVLIQENHALPENYFKSVKQSSEAVTIWRNKLYAHKDLSVALGIPKTPLPNINQEKMERAIEDINLLLDAVDQLYGGGVTAWKFDSGEASHQLISRLKVVKKHADEPHIPVNLLPRWSDSD
jgi:hypothetical protein